MLGLAFIFNTNANNLAKLNNLPDKHYSLIPGQKLLVLDRMDHSKYPERVTFLEKIDVKELELLSSAKNQTEKFQT